VPAFTGRSEHLARLDDVLSAEGAVAVLAGTAGVGKTALAVQWAHRVRDRFPDGQLYLDLRGHSPGPSLEPLHALAVLLDGLGVPAEQVPVDVDRAAALYRSLLDTRRVLIVLDNAAGAEQVRPLLPGSKGCAVLVTSRDQLGGLVAREGARRIALDVLPAPESHALLTRLLGEHQAASEPEAVAELARLCAHLPLALRIAAADVEESVAERVSDLASGDRLGQLAVDGDPSSAVRAAFDLSYTALDDGSQRMFRLLGIVPAADVGVPAAAAVADVPARDAQHLLRRLSRAHLVQSVGGRYTCHDLLCVYARERAEAEETPTERQAVLDRSLRWWLAQASAAARVLHPEMLRLPERADRPDGDRSVAAAFADRVEASAWLDAERANLVAAVRHAAQHGPQEVAWRLADALRGYFWLRMHGADWVAVAAAGLAAAKLGSNLAGQSAAHLSLGDAHGRQGHYDSAIEHYTQALRLNRQVGWSDGESAALGSLGNVYWWSGRMPEAADHYQQALRLARATGRVAGQAVNLGNLGAVYWELGRLELAVQHHEEALDIDRRLGAHLSEAVDLCNLGKVDVEMGELPRAVSRLERALSLHQEIGDRGGQAETLRVLALAHRAAGRAEQALELAYAAARLSRETGDVRWEADARNTVGHCLAALGRPQEAIEHHRTALDLARGSSIRYPEIVALMSLGGRLPDGEAALASAGDAVELARETGYRLLEGHALVGLGRAHARTGDDAAARSCWGEALDVLKSTGSAATQRVLDLLDASAPPQTTA
jgi:tetratricopeptide (TPR) repeat protein